MESSMPNYPEWLIDNIVFYLHIVIQKTNPGTQFLSYVADFKVKDYPLLIITIESKDSMNDTMSINIAYPGSPEQYIEIERNYIDRLSTGRWALKLVIKWHKNFNALIQYSNAFVCDYLNDVMKLNCAAPGVMEGWECVWNENEDDEPYLSIIGTPPDPNEATDQKSKRLAKLNKACEDIWVKITHQDPPDITKPNNDGHLGGTLYYFTSRNENIYLLYQEYSLEKIYNEYFRLYDPAHTTDPLVIKSPLNTIKPAAVPAAASSSSSTLPDSKLNLYLEDSDEESPQKKSKIENPEKEKEPAKNKLVTTQTPAGSPVRIVRFTTPSAHAPNLTPASVNPPPMLSPTPSVTQEQPALKSALKPVAPKMPEPPFPKRILPFDNWRIRKPPTSKPAILKTTPAPPPVKPLPKATLAAIDSILETHRNKRAAKKT